MGCVYKGATEKKETRHHHGNWDFTQALAALPRGTDSGKYLYLKSDMQLEGFTSSDASETSEHNSCQKTYFFFLFSVFGFMSMSRYLK